MCAESSLVEFFKDVDVAEKQRILRVLDLIAEREDAKHQPRQIRDIVPVKDWVGSKYYLGKIAEDLYPFWRDETVDFFERGYSEWIITGSIRSGKSYAGAIVTPVRRLYELSCYENPQGLYSLASITKIVMAYFSVSLFQARITGFGDIRNAVDDIPYFKEHFKRRADIDSLLDFPHNIMFIPGSEALHVLGTSLLVALLDETNFMRQGAGSKASFGKAFKLYTGVAERIRAAYVMMGQLIGFTVLMSSATEQSSFTENRIKLRDERTKVTNARLWVVKPGNYSKLRFWVFIGTERQDPFIIDDVAQLYGIVPESYRADVEAGVKEVEGVEPGQKKEFSRKVIKRLIDGGPVELRTVVIDVPEDFRRSFEVDIFSALKSLGGVSIAPAGKFFTSRAIWWKACDLELENAFSKEEIVLSTADDVPLMTYFRSDYFFNGDRPRRHPYEPRYIHVDQAKTKDAAGIACVHVRGYVKDEETGFAKPAVETDFILRMSAPSKPAEISMSKIYKFIMTLRNLGMRIGAVTYDQYQSANPIQILRASKINADVLSDRDDKHWIDFRDKLLDGTMFMCKHALLEDEFFNLDYDVQSHKIDHPEGGTKDISDALVGSVASLLKGVPVGMGEGSAVSDFDVTSSMGPDEEDRDISWVCGGYKYSNRVLRVNVDRVRREDFGESAESDDLDSGVEVV